MSNSNQLSKTISKNKINNCRSMSQEKKLVDATDLTIKDIKNKYPKIRFRHRKKIYKSEINEKLGLQHKDYGKNQSNPKSFIKPDGGIIEALVKGRWRIILISEAKKQGTNDRRMKKGKSRQAMGNAIERIYKNPVEMKNFLKNEKIFPFVLFVSGCDFYKGSSIVDRLLALNCGCSTNEPHIHKMKEENGNLESICSVYVRVREWGIPKMHKILFEAAEISIKHYLK